MELDKLARAARAQVVTPNGGDAVDIDRVYASDRMSDLLNAVTDSTLLVTNLSHTVLMQVIELMDVPAICFLHGVAPDAAVLQAAKELGTAVMVSPDGMFETCGRLYAALGLLNAEGQAM